MSQGSYLSGGACYLEDSDAERAEASGKRRLRQQCDAALGICHFRPPEHQSVPEKFHERVARFVQPRRIPEYSTKGRQTSPQLAALMRNRLVPSPARRFLLNRRARVLPLATLPALWPTSVVTLDGAPRRAPSLCTW